MKATVDVIGKNEFINKANKTSYVLELVDYRNRKVYRAFTSKAHYECIEEDSRYDGYLNFEKGFIKFYLPKDEVK